jgi:hypothetical protein
MNRMTESRGSGIYTNVRFHLVHYQLVTLGRNNGEPQVSALRRRLCSVAYITNTAW